LRFSKDLRTVMFIGGAWGVLSYVVYTLLVVWLPLPLAVVLGFTVFLPSLIGRIVVANTLLTHVVFDGFPMNVYVPTLWTEAVGTLISMFAGIGIVYFLRLIFGPKKRWN